MKKLTLNVELLAVDSFTTGDSADARGTVRGHDTRFTEFCNTKKTNCGNTCDPLCAVQEAAPQPAKPDEPFE